MFDSRLVLLHIGQYLLDAWFFGSRFGGIADAAHFRAEGRHFLDEGNGTVLGVEKWEMVAKMCGVLLKVGALSVMGSRYLRVWSWSHVVHTAT